MKATELHLTNQLQLLTATLATITNDSITAADMSI